MNDGKFSATRGRPRPGVLIAIVLFHLLALYGLVRAFAPEAVQNVQQSVVAAFTVTVTAPKEPPPEVEPEPDEGAAGESGTDAVPKPETAPTPRQRMKKDPPLPRAPATGTAQSAGANRSGEGTGAAGQGLGTGSGRGGKGRGGIAVTDPVKIAGDINSAADYPVPPGGRRTRFGTSVTIVMTVGTNGRASNCRVLRPSPDPVADRITCQLAVRRFRFRPAHDANGDPVAAPYGWRQEWFRR